MWKHIGWNGVVQSLRRILGFGRGMPFLYVLMRHQNIGAHAAFSCEFSCESVFLKFFFSQQWVRGPHKWISPRASHQLNSALVTTQQRCRRLKILAPTPLLQIMIRIRLGWLCQIWYSDSSLTSKFDLAKIPKVLVKVFFAKDFES